MSGFSYDSKNKDIQVKVNGVKDIPACASKAFRGHFDSEDYYRYAVITPMSGHDEVSLEHLVKSAIAYQTTIDNMQKALDNLHTLINNQNS